MLVPYYFRQISGAFPLAGGAPQRCVGAAYLNFATYLRRISSVHSPLPLRCPCILCAYHSATVTQPLLHICAHPQAPTRVCPATGGTTITQLLLACQSAIFVDSVFDSEPGTIYRLGCGPVTTGIRKAGQMAWLLTSSCFS